MRRCALLLSVYMYIAAWVATTLKIALQSTLGGLNKVKEYVMTSLIPVVNLCALVQIQKVSLAKAKKHPSKN